MSDSRNENEPVPAGGCTAPVLVFGEVLYDCFPDGHRVLGGAPFNVAWHLRGLGGEPLFVSAVGDDDDGASIRQAMENWGMDPRGLQTHPRLATGAVEVSFEKGEPSYEICAPRAWDAIADDGRQATRLLYHGSLALRETESREALEAIRGRSEGAVRFLDLNLRPPHYQIGQLRELIRGAGWLKLNLDELAELAGRDGLGFEQARPVAAEMRQRYGIGNVLLTAGGKGALLEGDLGSAAVSPAPAPETVADTVGAGDSFSAVAIHGILRGWDGERLLRAAAGFAARVCGLRGATTEDRNFYRGV
jgi:fructokinase